MGELIYMVRYRMIEINSAWMSNFHQDLSSFNVSQSSMPISEYYNRYGKQRDISEIKIRQS